METMQTAVQRRKRKHVRQPASVVSQTQEMSAEFVRADQMGMDDPGLPFPTDQELFEAEQHKVQEHYRLGIIANPC